GLSQELANARRVEDVASTFLHAFVSQLELPGAALLVPQGTSLVPVETPAYSPESLQRIRVHADGELAKLAAGLARPVRREELERSPEMEPELRPLVAAGVALCVPLVTRGRLVGLALALEKIAGKSFEGDELEIAQSLALAGATALDNTRLHRQAE